MAKKWMDGINVEDMEKFLADLRSGKYRQGLMRLNAKGEMCCLGVMTEGLKDVCGLRFGHDAYVSEDGKSYYALPPRSVLERLGIPDSHISCIYDTTDETNVRLVAHEGEYDYTAGEGFVWATHLNDTSGKSFAQIADRFEETFKVEVDA